MVNIFICGSLWLQHGPAEQNPLYLQEDANVRALCDYCDRGVDLSPLWPALWHFLVPIMLT